MRKAGELAPETKGEESGSFFPCHPRVWCCHWVSADSPSLLFQNVLVLCLTKEDTLLEDNGEDRSEGE